MKTLIKSLSLVLILSAAIAGCSKSSKSSSSGSSWAFGDSTYTSTTTGFTNNELLGIDNKNSSTPEIGIQFANTPTAGNYTVVNQYNTTVGANQCSIAELLGSNAIYVSTGSGTVTVTVSNGKITASFKNIEMGVLTGIDNNGVYTFTNAGPSSGTLTQQ